VILDLFGAGGGVGRCTREILRQLDAERVPTMLCGQSHVVDSFQDALQTMPGLQLANLERPKLSLKSLKIKFAARCGSHSSRLADMLFQGTINASRAGMKHSPVPVLVNYPQVIAPPASHPEFHVFIHDLNWRFYPGNFPDPELTDRNCRGWVDRASMVIANSKCTRDEIIGHYRCAPDKVLAAPLAPFSQKIARDFDPSKYLASLGLVAGCFDLYPGVWGLHKGHEMLTAAVELSQGAHPVVVTCGKPLIGIDGSTKAVAAIRKTLAARWDRLIEQQKLVVVGGVPEPGMQALRAGCRAYVLPAQYEGFGFPLAEAIYHHRPAIVSDIQAHREILDRYPQYKLGMLFPAGSSSALAEKLAQVEGESLRVPAGWQKDIETTWSWKNTIQGILSTLGSGTH
jgi:glycosyltransferase involved in cell wall biosynthesis